MASRRHGHVRDVKQQVRGILLSVTLGKADDQYVRPTAAVSGNAHQAAEVVAAAGTEEVVPAVDQSTMLCFRDSRIRLASCCVHPMCCPVRSDSAPAVTVSFWVAGTAVMAGCHAYAPGV